MHSPESETESDQINEGSSDSASAPPADVFEGSPTRSDIPAPVSPHIKRLKQRKDGPYFVTPDSVEPLPHDMWSDLDAQTVEKEAASFPELIAASSTDPNDPRPRYAVPQPQREFLQGIGDAGIKLLAELERGL